MDYALKKTYICHYYLVSTGITYFHWGKSFQCSLIIETTFTSSSESSALTDKGTFYTLSQKPTHTWIINFLFILFFFFICLPCQINTVPNILILKQLNSYQVNEKYWKKYKFNHRNLLVSEMPQGSSQDIRLQKYKKDNPP